MNKRKRTTVFVAQSAIIAAVYALLTVIFSPISFGLVQFRFSEALTILPVLTPAAIPGLAIGCLIANLSSPFGAADIIFGTLATLAAAVASRLAGKITFKKIPFLSALFPVLINGVVVGLELTYFTPGEASFAVFLTAFLSCVAGEAAVCFVLGIPLYLLLKKINLFKKW